MLFNLFREPSRWSLEGIPRSIGRYRRGKGIRVLSRDMGRDLDRPCLPELPKPKLQPSHMALSSGVGRSLPGPWLVGGHHGNDALLQSSMSDGHRAGCVQLLLLPLVS